MAQRILIVDDDQRLASMLAEYLSARGFVVDHRAEGEAGLRAAASGQYAAVILDVMLPDADGFEICRRLRASSPVPIVMLTACGDEGDRIAGLELGADDYLGKPFNPRELLARLKAVLRRASTRAVENLGVLRFGEIEIDREAREVRVGGKRRELTSHQFAVLRVLAERRGRVQSREQLMEAAAGQELEAFDRSIDVHVSRIRAAIEQDPRRPRYLKTVRSAGYVFVASEEEG